MDKKELINILTAFRDGKVSIDEIAGRISDLPYENCGIARIDHHRAIRHGFPEVVFARGKSIEQVSEIVSRLAEKEGNILVTHASQRLFDKTSPRFEFLKYNKLARIMYRHDVKEIKGKGKILIITAGTADLPVAEEARQTAEVMGNEVQLIADVGVAGIHRLLDIREHIISARVIIVAAGMEGALPSVVGGLASAPVIAVPTSIGYGTSFGGLTALMAMLNSCASNVVVVNINNGFGAAYTASMINAS